MTAIQSSKQGFIPYTYWQVDKDTTTTIEGGVIDETYLTIRVNGTTMATMMCSPIDQEALALGFIYNEGIIDTYEQIETIIRDEQEACIDIKVNRNNVVLRRQMILTSGCGGGVTFQQMGEHRGKVETDFITTPEIVHARMHDLQSAAQLYNAVRGVHTALLGSESEALYSAEDVGRHNTIDKIAGKAVRDSFDASQAILLTSGRISSEMIGKANRMNIPIVASRTAPTSISVRLAESWDICLIGYVRRDSFRIYTHPYRLGINV